MPAPTKPTIGKPDFATSDVIDPSSGQPNVVEPSAGKKANGWIYNEKPPRQYFNWLHRATTLWVTYLDAAMDWLKTEVSTLQGTVGTLVTNLGNLTTTVNNFIALFTNVGTYSLTVQDCLDVITIDFTYTKAYKTVTINWNSITVPANKLTNSGYVELAGTLPAGINIATPMAQVQPFVINGSYFSGGCYLSINNGTAKMTFRHPDPSTDFDKTQIISISAGSATYMVT